MGIRRPGGIRLLGALAGRKNVAVIHAVVWRRGARRAVPTVRDLGGRRAITPGTALVAILAVVALVAAAIVVHFGGTSHVGPHGEITEGLGIFLRATSGMVVAITGSLIVAMLVVVAVVIAVLVAFVVVVVTAVLVVRVVGVGVVIATAKEDGVSVARVFAWRGEKIGNIRLIIIALALLAVSAGRVSSSITVVVVLLIVIVIRVRISIRVGSMAVAIIVVASAALLWVSRHVGQLKARLDRKVSGLKRHDREPWGA